MQIPIAFTQGSFDVTGTAEVVGELREREDGSMIVELRLVGSSLQYTAKEGQ